MDMNQPPLAGNVACVDGYGSRVERRTDHEDHGLPRDRAYLSLGFDLGRGVFLLNAKIAKIAKVKAKIYLYSVEGW